MKKQITVNPREEENTKESYKYNGEIRFTADGSIYVGDLVIPTHARTIIIFSHGIGSSRHSVRNHKVAHYLNKKNIATLLVSLEKVDESLFRHGLSIEYLVDHLRAITRWVHHNLLTHHLAIGYFGASTGAAIALAAAAHEKGTVDAVVCRGGRPDLAMEELEKVSMPVLLIVGSEDKEGIALNEFASEHLNTQKELRIVDGASHLFEERGKLKVVANLAADWYHTHLLEEHERALETIRAV
ncbi:MAG: dienelactone hydrolase family protein [Chitinophagales bacterium]